MREVARKKGVEAVPGVAEDLPFPDESQDFILMVTVICFFDNVPEAFSEARRVLKPGGSIIVAFIDRDTPAGRMYEAGKLDSAFYQEATFYSAAEVKAMLEEAGFTSIFFNQTIFEDPREMTEVEPAKEGSGEGVFCVGKATK
jgi:SAM-dependent methyltransferase